MTQEKIHGVELIGSNGPARIGEQQIALRAYERWMGRGCPVSDGIEDWFAARSELELELAPRGRRSVTRTRVRGKGKNASLTRGGDRPVALTSSSPGARARR